MLRLELTPADHVTEYSVGMAVHDDDRRLSFVTTEVSYELVHRLFYAYEFDTVLDVGAGRLEHAKTFRALGKTVTTLDPVFTADVEGDIFSWETDAQFDCVFCSHVLEHQRNPGLFLDALYDRLKPGGLLALSVPPEAHHHVTFGHGFGYNAGYLIYHLVMAGFDCSDADVLTYGYNVSIIVRKGRPTVPRDVWCRDWEDVAPFFPSELQAQGNQIYGPLLSRNWTPVLNIPPHFNAGL